MTRETKVGLVVGTGIILLIGIVVSDHLSSQQRGQQQTAAPPGYTDLANGQPRSINPQGVRPLVDANASGDGAATLPLPQPHGYLRGNARDRNEQLKLNNITQPRVDGAGTIPVLPGPGGNTAPPVNNANNPGGIADANLHRDNNLLPPNVAEDLRRNNFLPEDPTPRLANPNGGTTDAGNRATEPLIHHVAAGDSLWSIAEKYYGVGNGRYFSEIMKANPGKFLGDNGAVREGVRLVIPNKVIAIPAPPVNNSANNPANNPANTPGAGNTDPNARIVDGSAGNTPTNPNNARPAMRTIKVEPGDSLSGIASQTLGSVRHMQLIIDANKDQIQDADDIKAGMTLRIPELPATANPPRTGTTPPANTNTAPGTTPPVTPAAPGAPRNVTPPAAGNNTVIAKTHKVQPRDTFSSIARTRLGSDRRWREIYELNRAQVQSPDALREGIVLVLPPDARQ